MFSPLEVFCNTTESHLEEVGSFSKMGSFEFYSPSISIKEGSDVSSCIPLSSPFDADHQSNSFPDYQEEHVMLLMEQGFQDLDDDAGLSDQFNEDKDPRDSMASKSNSPSVELLSKRNEDERSLKVLPISTEGYAGVPLTEPSVTVSWVGTKVDHSQLSMSHMFLAFAEAMDMKQRELIEEIMRWLKEKACPFGSVLERLACYLVQTVELDCLRREASQNYDAAFQTFYQIFPYGRFAHFTANSAILQAIPEDAHLVHIVDFDILNGVQWPPLFDFLARQGQKLVKLTSVQWQEGDSSSVRNMYSLNETMKRLREQAQISGVRLMAEEMVMEDLVNEMQRTMEVGVSEWLVFNCMVGLPHMGRGRTIAEAVKFLKIAKDSINLSRRSFCGSSVGTGGIITLGDGSGVLRYCGKHGLSFGAKLIQFKALLESMELCFPCHLIQAKISMECLFLAPHVSSLFDFQNWEMTTRDSTALSELGLKAWGMKRERVLEAKELVREGKTLFSVGVGGERANQLVLSFMGTPLVRVSSWS